MAPSLFGKRFLFPLSKFDEEEEGEEHQMGTSALQPYKRSKQDNQPELSYMPEDVLCNVTSFLEVGSLIRVRLLNRNFRILASRESAGWENLCQKLWAQKVHVLREAQNHADSMAAYRLSVEDARDRDHIEREELVFDPSIELKGTVWSFRFKDAAGADWTSWDPWHNGQSCRKLVFLEDGTVKQYFVDKTESLENPQFSQSGTLVEPPMPMTWRFLTRPLDLPARPMGSYIRFAVGGRDVPTYCVRRSPTKNWGFIMESCWGVYASFELPKRPRMQRRLPHNAHQEQQDPRSNWLNADEELGVEEEEEEDDSSKEELSFSDGLLINDDSFAISSGLQWREAFLYNFGARALPEGDEAVAEFERTYGASLNQET